MPRAIARVIWFLFGPDPVLTGDEGIGVAQPFWKRRPHFDLWHYLPKTICPLSCN